MVQQMLIYLDTAQFAWLEQADAQVRSEFIEDWRQSGCHLALSLQLLQEAAKRGSQQDIDARLATMRSLHPLRGIPAGSAGVMVREVTVQMAARLGKGVDDPIGYGTATIFPMMPDDEPEATVRGHSRELEGFNIASSIQAELEASGKTLPPLKKNETVDPDQIEHAIRALLSTLPPESASFHKAVAEAVIDDARAADGNAWQARLERFGLSRLKCLPDIRPEDLSKAAGFLEAARFAVDDIAWELGAEEEEVRALILDLRPYEAPGYSLEMAVSRARVLHNASPKASDKVDEEHVCFAPYVDLLFADKRTRAFIDAEMRREDGRVVPQTAASISVARDLQDVREQIGQLAARGQRGD